MDAPGSPRYSLRMLRLRSLAFSWVAVLAALTLATLTTVVACSSSSSPDGAAASDSGSPDATVLDAGPDVDNGAPSTNYPAPHPVLPQLVNAAKGPVLTNPKIELLYYPCDADAGATKCDGLEPQVEAFAQKMAGSSYWATTTSEYGVGPIAYSGSIALTGEVPPTTIANTDVQTYMIGLLQSGKLGVPDPQTIYTLVYPSSTVVTEANPLSVLLGNLSSCKNFTGYHERHQSAHESDESRVGRGLHRSGSGRHGERRLRRERRAELRIFRGRFRSRRVDVARRW
jgi:hypothetical protein